MITVINLNVSIDKRYELEDIIKGKVMRARAVENTAGGKGLHVANVAAILGEEVFATGFIGGETGEFIVDKLQEMGINNNFIKIKGATRECLAFITDDLIQTEILEPGPEVTNEELNLFLSLYETLLLESSIVVASGSIPQNIPKEIYADLIRRASAMGKKFLLDTSGELLVKGMEAKPFFIKPNKEELEMITGQTFVNEEHIFQQINKLNAAGIEWVVVSLGDKGFLAGHQGKKYKVQIPKVTVKNPVGSGDALVSGFAVGLERNYSIEKLLAFAAACGTANAMEVETGFVRKKEVEKIAREITVLKL